MQKYFKVCPKIHLQRYKWGGIEVNSITEVEQGQVNKNTGDKTEANV